ncbi:RDD family protein [Sphaerobacter sp.]|uniref:RDD family protein n=1 Tax=Sphaerobacter sp. TaxID=2099654 RepID=UPI001DF37027|nr:RDD family protein [Sphaerobacter sp.]MBX5444944.1 RDD family protein [Sphaerobacter sp.]
MSTAAQILLGKGVYRTPDGKRAARYAGAIPRAVGSIIDWFICFFWFIFSALGSSFLWNTFAGPDAEEEAGLAGWAWLAVVAIGVVAYFTLTVARGGTVGMRILQLRILDPETGEPPRRSRALIRALMAATLGGAFLVLANFVLSGRSATSETTAGYALLITSFLLLIAGMWSHLYALFDPRGQTLQDRLAGVVVVVRMIDIPEDLVIFDRPETPDTSPEPSPAKAEPLPNRKNRKRRRR